MYETRYGSSADRRESRISDVATLPADLRIDTRQLQRLGETRMNHRRLSVVAKDGELFGPGLPDLAGATIHNSALARGFGDHARHLTSLQVLR